MVLSVVGRVNSIVLKGKLMKANQGAIVLIEQPADHGRLRSVLHDWGYTEAEIKRFVNENEMSPLIQVSMNQRMQMPIRGQALPHE